MNRSRVYPRLKLRPAWLLGVAFLVPVVAAHAQSGPIAGVVTDRVTGQPVESARIQIGTSTTLATATDARGRFVLRAVPVGQQTLRVTRIGFRPETQTVAVVGSDTTRVTFQLSMSAVELAAVVTTGTGGAVEKKKIGSSIGTVNLEEMQDIMPVADLGSALAAKVTGLRSVSVGGGAGAAKDLRIRGVASFSLSQRPVVYIDGVRVDTRATEWTFGNIACCSFAGGTSTDRISDLNPSEIERVEVLKGAAAATLYGSEATNGVIQIFTKRGRAEQRPTWNVGVATGFNRLRENLPTKLYPNFSGPDGTRARDANTLIESGLHATTDLSVQGGGQRSTYFIAGSYLLDEGSIKPNDERKGNLRLNLTFLPTDKWTVEARSAYTKNFVNEAQAGNNWTALLGNAMNGDPRKASKIRPFGEAWVPVSDIAKMKTQSDVNRWTGGLTASYAMFTTFTHRLTVGLDVTNDEKSRFFPYAGDYASAGVTRGQRNIGNRSYRTATFDYLGQLSLKLPMGIGSDLAFGTQGFFESQQLSLSTGNTFPGPGVSTVSSAAVTNGGEQYVETTNIGMLAQNRFSFGEKMFATVGVRVDGNSAFGENYGFQTYPKADLSWIASAYHFLPTWVSSLKLRTAIGQAGKTPGAFDKFTTFEPAQAFEATPAVVPSNPGNADLRPETTTEIEAGFESGYFNDRLGIEGSLYRATTADAIVNKSNPPSEGFLRAKRVNIGEIENTGWEVSVNYLAIAKGRFEWTTNVRADGNKNRVTDLGGLVLGGNQARIDSNKVTGKLTYYPVGGVWSRKATGFRLDAAGKPETLRSDSAVFFGPPLPTFNGSWGNTIRFGPFQFYGLLTMERGAFFSNGDRPYRVRQGGSDEYLQFLDAAGKPTFQADSVYQMWGILDAIDSRDNVRLRELSVTYSLPDRISGRMRLGRTSITLAGQNLNWWDHCNCVDPNMNWAGADPFGVASGFLAQPSPRTVRFSIRSRF